MFVGTQEYMNKLKRAEKNVVPEATQVPMRTPGGGGGGDGLLGGGSALHGGGGGQVMGGMGMGMGGGGGGGMAPQLAVGGGGGGMDDEQLSPISGVPTVRAMLLLRCIWTA